MGRLGSDDLQRPRANACRDGRALCLLYRLSREARSDGVELADVVGAALSERGTFADETTYGEVNVERSFRRGSRPSYDDEPDIAVIEFDVRSRSLTMSAESPGVERTVEFAGVYTRLQNDLRRVLGWAWL